ncbi:MAG: helix-turn-helix domain-containing protein [Oscillospiraceae bacterium]|nr:helix-turn-helix domain-containing protein [Oscillospiraceae bacterium]
MMAERIFTKKFLSWDEVPALLTLEQAAILLRLGTDCIRKHCISGVLPGKQIGKTWYIDKQLLMKMFGYK